jgi:cysteine desulfurase NifS
MMEMKKGICGICPAGCWVEVGVEDGRLVGIEADTGHPLGMICWRGRYAPEIVHSEHRLQHPMRRIGPKGSYDFERITWDEAYDSIVANLNTIKRESGPEAVAIYTGRGAFELSLCDMFQPKGVAVSSASNVLFPFGSPNTMGVGALCYVSFAMIAPHVTLGTMLVNMFSDIENAELIVVWGANPATDSPPLDMHRLEAAARRGARVVVIDPRNTKTVKRVNGEWVPIRPGSDGALALGLINVMIEDDLYDEDFAVHWCHGFDDLASYVQHFTPEVVQEVTGVSADTVRTLARAICAASGACPLMYTGLEYSNSGVQAIRAVQTVFALAGHLDVPGGIGLAMRDSHFPINRSCNIPNPNVDRAVGCDEFPIYSSYRGESHASGLVDSVLQGSPYRIRGLIVHGASLLTSWPQTSVWRDTLHGLDFLVCIDRQMTADMAAADIILPATTMFEINSYMVYGPIFRLREALIDPVGEARNDYLIMAELARRLGYGDRFPQTEEELIRFALDGSGHSVEEIREAGGWIKIATPMMEYRKWEKGGLRGDGEPGFDTPTGRFEIHSTVLEEYGYEPLPKYVEPTEGPLNSPELRQQFPLVFNSGARPQTDFRSQHHGIDALVTHHPEPTVELNSLDAGTRDIRSGDLVEVRTGRGGVKFRARVTDDIVPGAVECSMGGGTAVGPKAWREWNVNHLTDIANRDEISGFPVYKALLCDVRRIERGDCATRNGEPTSSLPESDDWSKAIAERRAPRKRIYLDNNATSIMPEAVRETMQPYLAFLHGNPSSIHGAGRDARAAVETARRQVAGLLNCRPRRVVFTGGGSESDNMALKGVALAHRDRGNHIVTTRVEHPAVLGACGSLERMGFRVTYLPVDEFGIVDSADLSKSITDNTILVSVMMANNEVGSIQPIRDLCAIAHERGALFHTDAVQAAGKIPVDVNELDVDLLTVSAHKLHGPKGVGALYKRKEILLEPLIHGGKQESGLRAGTENVPAIVGFGKAAEIARHSVDGHDRVQQLRDSLESTIRERVPEAKLNGHPEHRLPNTLNLTLPGLRGESLVVALDQHGISLSSGSACKAGSPDPTHVLIAMGKTPEDAHCAVRFSLSRYTTEDEVRETGRALASVLEEMETTVRFLPCK